MEINSNPVEATEDMEVGWYRGQKTDLEDEKMIEIYTIVRHNAMFARDKSKEI